MTEKEMWVWAGVIVIIVLIIATVSAYGIHEQYDLARHCIDKGGEWSASSNYCRP